MSGPNPGEIVHRLPRGPAHLYQLNTAPDAYHNKMGCGAFTTAMALSCYDPARFGTYAAARQIFEQMLKVPIFGGTFESQNAAIGRRYNFATAPFDRGTLRDLAAAIDAGAPTIMLVDPGWLGIGRHDVLLVGYSVNAQGRFLKLFVDNPAYESATIASPPGTNYPGNEIYPVEILPQKWTRCFTPFFASDAAFAQWRAITRRT